MGVCWHDAHLCHQASDRSMSSARQETSPDSNLCLKDDTNSLIVMWQSAFRKNVSIWWWFSGTTSVQKYGFKTLAVLAVKRKTLVTHSLDRFGKAEANAGRSCEFCWLSETVNVFNATWKGHTWLSWGKSFLSVSSYRVNALEAWGAAGGSWTRKGRNAPHWVNNLLWPSVHLSLQNYD